MMIGTFVMLAHVVVTSHRLQGAQHGEEVSYGLGPSLHYGRNGVGIDVVDMCVPDPLPVLTQNFLVSPTQLMAISSGTSQGATRDLARQTESAAAPKRAGNIFIHAGESGWVP